MATQTRLHLNSFHLDAKSREAGRRGLEKARAALAEATGAGDVMAQLVSHTEANRYVGNSNRLHGLRDVPLRQRQKDAELAQKDLRAAIARAGEVGVRLPSAELAVSLMHRLWGAEQIPEAPA